MENFNNLMTGVFDAEDLLNDGWTDIIGKLLLRLRNADLTDLSPGGVASAVEMADFEKMESIRARVDTIVNDPTVGEALKPYYRQFSGFEVGTDYTRRAGYDIVGREGITLSAKWRDGVAAFHGLHSRGFPNLFIFSLHQSGFTLNFPHALDEQSKHTAHIVRHVFDHDIATVETSQEAEDAWVATILEQARCSPTGAPKVICRVSN